MCTRLGRYILEELTGWRHRWGRLLVTALTAGTPLFFVMQTITDTAGKPVPAWRVFWPLSGRATACWRR